MVIKILWVDDEPWFHDSHREALLSIPAQVDRRETASEAVQRVRECVEAPYDLLILDIMMPCETLDEQLRMNRSQLEEAAERGKWGGLEVYKAVEGETPQQRVMIYSVVPASEIRRRFEEQGLEFHGEYERKGGSREDFLAAVRRSLAIR